MSALFSIDSDEPWGFSTFLYIFAVVTHVAQRDVLYELHARLHPVQSDGILPPQAYCCLTCPIRIDNIQRRMERE